MSELFLKIVNMSISASWIVVAVLALRFCLEKAPKWVNVLRLGHCRCTDWFSRFRLKVY